MRQQRRQQQGFIVGLAMLAIVVLSFFLVTSSTTMLSSVKVGGTYSRTVDIFNIAEVGIAKARPLIEGQNLSTLLASYTTTPLTTGSFNGGSYRVFITDNDDGDGTLTSDDDNIIIVQSIATGATGGRVQINTHLQLIDSITTPDDPSGGPTAGLLCGASSQTKTQGSAQVSGCDWTLPALPCTGAGCNGATSDGDTTCEPTDSGGYAIAAESALTTTGTGYNGPLGSPTVSGLGTDNSHCDDWVDLSTQIASLPSGAPGVTVFTGSTISGGTVSNDCTTTPPQVYIINSTSSTVNFTGNNTLCGILVVASNTSIKLAGTSTFVGIIMVMGNNTTVDFDATSGTSNVFGQIITNEITVDTGNEVDLKGNASIKYSSAAVDYAKQALSNSGVGGGGALLTVAWEEQY